MTAINIRILLERIDHAIGEYNQSTGGEWHLTEDEREVLIRDMMDKLKEECNELKSEIDSTYEDHDHKNMSDERRKTHSELMDVFMCTLWLMRLLGMDSKDLWEEFRRNYNENMAKRNHYNPFEKENW